MSNACSRLHRTTYEKSLTGTPRRRSTLLSWRARMLGVRLPQKGAAARPKKAWQLEQEGVLPPPHDASAAPARSPRGAAGGRGSASPQPRRSRSRSRSGRSERSRSSSRSRSRSRSKSRSRSRSSGRGRGGSAPRAAAAAAPAALAPAALLSALLRDVGDAEARASQLETLADAAGGGAQVRSAHLCVHLANEQRRAALSTAASCRAGAVSRG